MIGKESNIGGTIANSSPQELESYSQKHFILKIEEKTSELNICLPRPRITAKVNIMAQKLSCIIGDEKRWPCQ
jgi:hypothetical protein